ncbi:MAG: hypothetical protein ABSH12_08845 [Endomicrobiales bacterium]|jgi:D-alanine-D-alanine ligase
MKKLDILMLHDGIEPLPDEKDFDAHVSTPEWSTEISIYRAIKARGHDVRFVGIYDDVKPLLDEIKVRRPDAVFNLAEAWLGEYQNDKNIVSLLELLGIPYTGCSPMGLMICNHKALTKKILLYHGIKVPRFCVFRVGETVKFPAEFSRPYFVKPLREEASMGISQRSLAETEDQCRDRISFIHQSLGKDALVEEYIDGRELYVGVIGTAKSIKVLPVWELKFTRVPDSEPKIATYKAKWDENYRKKWGIKNECADQLPEGIDDKIADICKIAFRVLYIDGYARFDLRLTPEGDIYILEANANPELARGEDFAASAEKDGIIYEDLTEKILQHALQRSVAP